MSKSSNAKARQPAPKSAEPNQSVSVTLHGPEGFQAQGSFVVTAEHAKAIKQGLDAGKFDAKLSHGDGPQ